MSTSRPLTDEQFRQICHDIEYEIVMLHEAVRRYTDRHVLPGISIRFESPQVEYLEYFDQNLLIEAIALHSRVLISFLFDKPRKDDVFATSFFDTYSGWTPGIKGKLLQ